LRILETDASGPLLAATFSGSYRALTTANLLKSFAALPFLSLKIVGAIHWEALRLWLKGVRLVPRLQAAPQSHFAVARSDAYIAPAQSPSGPASDRRDRALIR
jgi:DUF1365 family protein